MRRLRPLAACALALASLGSWGQGALLRESDCWRIASAVWARTAAGETGCLRYGSAGLHPGPNPRVLVMLVSESELQEAADQLHARLGVPLILLAQGEPHMVAAALDVLKDRHGIAEMLLRD